MQPNYLNMLLRVSHMVATQPGIYNELSLWSMCEGMHFPSADLSV